MHLFADIRPQAAPALASRQGAYRQEPEDVNQQFENLAKR